MLALLLAAAMAQAQPAPSARRPDPCAQASDCRVVRDFDLRGPQGQRVPVRLGGGRTPWLPEGNIMLFPKESVTVRFEAAGDRLTPRLVRTGAASAAQPLAAGELRVSFAQAPDAALVLTLESRLAQSVQYDVVAVSVLNGPKQPLVQPVAPGRTTVERWNAPIGQVALANFRPAGSTASVAPAIVGGRLALPLGRTAVVRFEPAVGGLQPRIVEAGPAEARLGSGAIGALAVGASAVQASAKEESVTAVVGRGAPKSGAPDQAVRFTFGRGPDGRSLLLAVENGTDRVLDYRAIMVRPDGRRRGSTICRVPPGIPVIESWSDSFTALELESFELLPAAGDMGVQARICD